MSLIKRGRSGIFWVDLTVDGRRIRKSTGQVDKAIAKRIHDKVLGQIAERKWFERLPGEDITFMQMMTRYMDEHSKIKKKSWLRDEVSLSHLLPVFGELRLTEINSDLISRYKSRRLKEGAKPATLNKELALTKHAYNLAIKEWDWLKENPFCKVKMEKENNARDRVLSYEEEGRLLNVCPLWLKEIIIFALNTGAREGEILGLTWKEVDLFKRVVTIHQDKTEQNKTIPLTSTAFDLLKNKAKVRHLHQNFVFSTENATRITASNLGRGFRLSLKRAKIENFKFHDLRHTFASRLAQAGIDLYLIQKLLGHKDPRMTQRYSHYNVESLRNGIEVLEKIQNENERLKTQIGHSESF